MADNFAHPCNRCRVLAIDDLSDDDLLSIFDFYVVRYEDLDLRGLRISNYETIKKIESWQSLVHVCRRWRGLVFGSPRRLNLQLFCIPGLSARNSLDIWPALPLILGGNFDALVDNITAKLEHTDRICQIDLFIKTISQIGVEKLCTAMQVPFPELAVLCLTFRSWSYLPVFPDSFLSGSAPRLRYLTLTSVPFPGLPKLLLSANHLVHLTLLNIPSSGYISPETMAICLSVLTSLVTLQLEFARQPFPDQGSRRPSPPTRSVLPALEVFLFNGVGKYLEKLLAQIVAPRLYLFSTDFLDHNDFDTPGLGQFISHTSTFGTYDEAHLIFRRYDALVMLRQLRPKGSDHRMVEVKTPWDISLLPDWQPSFLAQICTSSLRPLLTMENLYIYESLTSPPNWRYDTVSVEWLDLLLPFTAVKNLHLSKLYSPHIAPALRELSEGRTAEVLPALQNVLLEGFQPSEPVQEGIWQFMSARQLTSHPVSISVWDRDDY